MSMTDPIADFLTRVRNAIQAAHETVDDAVLEAEGRAGADPQGAGLHRVYDGQAPRPTAPPGEVIQIRLKYTEDRRSVISGLRRVSTPGPAHVRRREEHPEGAGRHGHRDRLDLARGHDRPRGARRRTSAARSLAQVW